MAQRALDLLVAGLGLVPMAQRALDLLEAAEGTR
jgi:hypothetical protein